MTMIVKSNGVVIKEIRKDNATYTDRNKEVLYSVSPIIGVGLIDKLRGVCEASRKIVEYADSPSVPKLVPLPHGSLIIQPQYLTILALILLCVIVLIVIYIILKGR